MTVKEQFNKLVEREELLKQYTVVFVNTDTNKKYEISNKFCFYSVVAWCSKCTNYDIDDNKRLITFYGYTR